MALSGIRDMSTIEEPPLDRYPVQTFVLEHVDHGSAPYRGHRARGAGPGAARSTTSTTGGEHRPGRRPHPGPLPEAEVAVAHGKMDEEQLGDVMERMAGGEIQILVCTTIIETGIDIPNVNTLIMKTPTGWVWRSFTRSGAG